MQTVIFNKSLLFPYFEETKAGWCKFSEAGRISWFSAKPKLSASYEEVPMSWLRERYSEHKEFFMVRRTVVQVGVCMSCGCKGVHISNCCKQFRCSRYLKL